MQENFLEKFIEEERFLQNPPMETRKFIEFCKKLGIETDENELEFFEKEGLLYPIIRIDRPIVEEERIKFMKDGKTFWRPAVKELQEGETELKKYKVSYYSFYGFDKYDKELNYSLLKTGNLFDPSTKPFQKWSSFKGEKLRNGVDKIVSFYSSFQIHWLEILKKDYSVKINFAGERIKISSNCNSKGVFNPGSFSINNFNEFNDKLKEIIDDDVFTHYFDFKNKKNCLKPQYENFNKILEFLLSIQSIYSPYGRSSSKTMNVKDENWHEKRIKFNSKKELDNSGFSIKEIANIYGIFSQKAIEILGVKRDDWVQLWKGFAWNEKDKLEGDIRLGVEYLQWALMLKRFIEDYCEREILDVDEISNISRNDILNFNPLEMDKHGRLLRALRNKDYFDPEKNKNYFYDRYKRLFYLANDFNLDYQPRIMIFVEGETEEQIFPKIFEWYYNHPENLGIEIVNFKGVDQLLSTSNNAEELKNLIDNIQKDLKQKCISTNKRVKLSKLIRKLNKMDIIISNWTSFVSYNLERWQIIPFFISDNEGNVKHFLDAGKPIKFKGKNYDIPAEWKYLWGVTNENKPYYGNNFELANFSDEEILLAVNEVLKDNISIDIIKEIRKQDEGIKKIDKRILNSHTKRKIVSVMFENLFEQYDEKKDESILKRPIFKLIRGIIELAQLNHPPVNTVIELHNQKIILELLSGERESIIDN